MEISIIDKSNYLKGLLITARKDNQLTETEKKILKDLTPYFCANRGQIY